MIFYTKFDLFFIIFLISCSSYIKSLEVLILGIKFEFYNGQLLAMISGEIDHHTAAEFRKQIDKFMSKNKTKKLVLDFSQVNFMDTSGIGFIMGRFKTAFNSGVELKVVNIPKKLERLVQLSGIKNLGILG